MAILTSHTLNGADGTHAGNITVTLRNLITGETILKSKMDTGGRLFEQIDASIIDQNATYELVFDTASYWVERNTKATVEQIALRFGMPDREGSYHMPVILNPNSYSMWCSA
ncbi:MAG: hypothetical protein HN551_01250 [Tateyamaria sp.]|jgi:5-hydroxyisourate hydrolase|nr:hypothetical protein [Tateyamaria sp.]MBT6344879.1 hypothetical protein [Tateyamaria sp.]MBT7447611.1 hypothetical protein [Tateyamaria sp.]MBT7799860.1 hypothetical protein [Tateyamaria sp.]